MQLLPVLRKSLKVFVVIVAALVTSQNLGLAAQDTLSNLFGAVARPHPKTADLIISFNKFESSSLNILVVHWWNSTDPQVKAAVSLRRARTFRRNAGRVLRKAVRRKKHFVPAKIVVY